MRKIRNFLYFFICSFHLNCPTTEEQITDRQVLQGVTQKVSSNSKHTLLCLCGHNVLARIKPNTIVLQVILSTCKTHDIDYLCQLLYCCHIFLAQERLSVDKQSLWSIRLWVIFRLSNVENLALINKITIFAQENGTQRKLNKII